MNKSNAHLYLPFVQALAEGKTIQRKGLEWYDCKDTDFTWSPDQYRIKPLEWPPIPEGCSLHNPDKLTPEQVGDGWRLTVEDEPVQIPDVSELWDMTKEPAHFRGRNLFKGNDYCPMSTYRVPISTPFPDGSKIVDGKLAKPWVPKFENNSRVRIISALHRGKEGNVVASTLPTTSQSAQVNVYPHGWFCEKDLELAPCPEPKKQVPLDWNDWLKDGPWWVRAGEIDPYPCLVVEAGPVAIYFGQDKRTSHEDAMSYERSNDGINWQPCSKLLDSNLPSIAP